MPCKLYGVPINYTKKISHKSISLSLSFSVGYPAVYHSPQPFLFYFNCSNIEKCKSLVCFSYTAKSGRQRVASATPYIQPHPPTMDYPVLLFFPPQMPRNIFLLHFTFFACVLVSDDGLRASGGCSRDSMKREGTSWQVAGCRRLQRQDRQCRVAAEPLIITRLL